MIIIYFFIYLYLNLIIIIFYLCNVNHFKGQILKR